MTGKSKLAGSHTLRTSPSIAIGNLQLGTRALWAAWFTQASRLSRTAWWRLAVVATLLAGAAAIRSYRLQVPGLLPDREYHAATLARADYFQTAAAIPEWRREMAQINAQREEVLEPPILEALVASLYRVAGGEYLWIARLLSATFWLAGAVFLTGLANRLTSFNSAVISTAYFLFVPLGVLTSRSFQPDALMMMLFLMSLFLLVRYHDQPTRGNLVAAAAVAGLALLVRPLVLFTLWGAALAAAASGKSARRSTSVWHGLAFAVISLLPALLYYGYFILISGVMRWKVETSFMPHLLLQPFFWKEWLLLAVDGVGLMALAAGLLGVAMLSKGFPRSLVVALWAGYAVFGLAFNFHIHTHGYYQLQLIPIVALSFGPLVDLSLERLRRVCTPWYWWFPVVGGMALIFVFGVREVRGRLVRPNFESEAVSGSIGAAVGHSSRVVYLSPFYGRPLKYYAEIAGDYWPRPFMYWLYGLPGGRAISLEERFQELDFVPEYFVITNFREYEAHHADLRDFLTNNCRLVAQTDDYLIYEIEACTQAFVHPGE